MIGSSTKSITRRFFSLYTSTLIGLALRICWGIYTQNKQISDFEDYVSRAQVFSINKDFFVMGNPSHYRMPGWPVFLSIFNEFLPSQNFIRILCIVLSAALIPTVYFLANELKYQRKSCEILSWLVAIYPPFVQYSVVAGAEHLAILLLLLAIIYFMQRSQNNRRSAFLSGLFLSLPTFARPEYIFLAPAMILLTYGLKEKVFCSAESTNLMTSSRAALSGLGKIIRNNLIIIVGYLILPFLWATLNSRSPGGSFGLTTTFGCNLLMAINEEGFYGWRSDYQAYCSTFDLQKEAIKEVISVILKSPEIVLLASLKGVFYLFTSPSNYGLDWAFTCITDEFCASLRAKDNYSEIARYLFKVLNYLTLVLGYGSFTLLVRRILRKCPSLATIKSFLIFQLMGLSPLVVYMTLLVPFNSRFRIILDLYFMVILTFLINYFQQYRDRTSFNS